MRTFGSIVSASVCSFLGLFLGSAATVTVVSVPDPPEPSWTTKAVVTEVHDGDTLTVEIRRKIRVRLLDAWAPEVKADNRLPESKRAAEKAAGIASREHLKGLSLGKEVVLQIPADEDLLKSTTMGRVLGTVWLDGAEKSLNQIQVETGHATREKREELKK